MPILVPVLMLILMLVLTMQFLVNAKYKLSRALEA